MENKITTIIVNPKLKTIETKEIVASDIAKEVGATPLSAVYFQDHVMILDDEGLLRSEQHHFKISYKDVVDMYKLNTSFCGNGVIVKINPEGEEISATLDIEDVRKHITFLNPSEVSELYQGDQEEIDQPYMLTLGSL
jgi:hypothetical protein